MSYKAASLPLSKRSTPGKEISLLCRTALTGRKDRAEQNKKAQQAFRKRREERMKELEAAAATLEPMQRKLHQTEDKLSETALVSGPSLAVAHVARWPGPPCDITLSGPN